MRKQKVLFASAIMMVGVARASVEGALKKMTGAPVSKEKVVGGEEKETVFLKLARSSRLGIAEIDEVTAELYRNSQRQRFGPAPRVLIGFTGRNGPSRNRGHMVAYGKGG